MFLPKKARIATRRGYLTPPVIIVLALIVLFVAISLYLNAKIFSKPEPSPQPVVQTSTDQPQTSITTSPPNNKSKTLRTFVDSKGATRHILLEAADPDPNTGEFIANIYLGNSESYTGAKKITNVGSSDLGQSPFISKNQGTKYIVIEKLGPGDGQEIVIFDENGKLVTESLYEDNYKAMGVGTTIQGQIGLHFKDFLPGTSDITVEILSATGDLDYLATFNASTGKLAEVHKI